MHISKVDSMCYMYICESIKEESHVMINHTNAPMHNAYQYVYACSLYNNYELSLIIIRSYVNFISIYKNLL